MWYLLHALISIIGGPYVMVKLQTCSRGKKVYYPHLVYVPVRWVMLILVFHFLQVYLFFSISGQVMLFVCSLSSHILFLVLNKVVYLHFSIALFYCQFLSYKSSFVCSLECWPLHVWDIDYRISYFIDMSI